MELFGEFLDELTEVDATVGGVVEDGFSPIALILNVVELHIEFQARCNLTATVQGVVFLTDGFEELLHVVDTSTAVNLFELRHRSVILFAFALFLDELAHHGHYADVVSDGCLHRN